MNIRLRGLLATLVACSMQGGLAAAAVPPAPSPLQDKSFRDPGMHVPELQQRVQDLGDALAPGLTQQLAAFGITSDYGFYDSRAGRWSSLMLKEPLMPGDGVGNRLRWSDFGSSARPSDAAVKQQVWDAVQAYLERHHDALRIDPAELGTPRIGLFESDNFVVVYSPRVVRGILVRDSSVTAVLNHGHLVLLGLQNWGDVPAPAAAGVGPDRAKAAVADHVRPFPMAGFTKDPYLELIPTLRGDAYDFRLAWVVRAAMVDDQGSWEGLVDASTGELFAFEDKNQYAARKIVGGVYPVSNDQRPPDGVEQTGWPMPHSDVVVGGNTLFSNSGGVFGCSTGTATTTFSGRFVKIADVCGAVSESSAAGDIDTASGPSAAATDCTVPVGHSAGDTKASRTGMYELNRLIEQAKGHLPTNAWLQGQLLSNMNIVNSCNAFWGGSSVNFYRDSANCRNTGEIAAIFDHEWGHGMDNNGVNNTISSPGEAIADIHAMMRLNQSCTGRGFFKTGVCSGYGDACDGTIATGCTGVRDLDFMNHRCDLPHTITWALSGFTVAQCPAAPGGAAACPTGGGTPCGRETHCEGMISAEAGWDLQFRDLRAAPFNFDENTALELATRLSFLGSQALTSWYSCSVGGGCGATNGYPLFLAADDDNGNVTDGTPHMQAIRGAFQRHEIHCATPPVANTGCSGGPTTAPTVTATALDQGASLSWASVPGAARYGVYRTDGVFGCSFGKIKVGETTGTTFVDSGLQNGRVYNYAVLPIGTNTSCFGRMSACAPVTPVPGPNLGIRQVFTIGPTGVGGDGDPFIDNCERGTATITVENTGTGTLNNVRITAITSPSHPGTVINTPLPATIAASLTDCASANGTFTFTPNGLNFGDTLTLQVTVTANELAGQTRTITISALQTESDLSNVPSRTYNFETDFNGWTVQTGTWTRKNPGANGTNTHLSSSEFLDNQCDIVRSPFVRLRATSTLSLYNRYDTETPVPIPYDRANVGVNDILAATRTTVVPSGGRPYDLPPGAPNGACVTGDQAGWSQSNPTPTFAQSTWNSGALNPGGIFTNRLVQLDVAYGTDPAANGAGFDFDEVVLTDFDEIVADAQPNSCVPRVSFTAASQTRAENAGPAPFSIVLTTPDGAATTGSVSVNYATAPGTATAPGDYTITSGTATFPSGTASGTAQNFSVPLTNDTIPELTEAFTVNLSGPVNGVVYPTATHTITITDDDAANFIRGDFNSDGKTDILWRHSESGENVLWYMNGAQLAGGEFLTPAALTDTRWKMVGTHDFNGDLKNDILWRHDVSGENVLWFMNGSVLTSGTFLTPSALADVRWKMAGTGYVDGDIKPDIVWHHIESGQVVVWFMNGTQLVSGTFTTPSSFPDLNWRLVGVADFSNPLDGKPDFVWRNQSTGDLLIWYMNGTTQTSTSPTTPGSLTDTRWNLVATGDYNLDLKNDFVWRHSVSGENVIWFMNGASLINGTFTTPASFPDVRWQMVGPR
jgi:hypothetical protein